MLMKYKKHHHLSVRVTALLILVLIVLLMYLLHPVDVLHYTGNSARALLGVLDVVGCL